MAFTSAQTIRKTQNPTMKAHDPPQNGNFIGEAVAERELLFVDAVYVGRQVSLKATSASDTSGRVLTFPSDSYCWLVVIVPTQTRSQNEMVGSFWHTFSVRGVAKVRQLSEVHSPCARRRRTGEF